MWSFWVTLHTAQQCFIFSARKMLHAPQVRFIKFSWSVISFLNQDFFFLRKYPATMVLHIRVWESYGRGSVIFFRFCFVFSASPSKNPQSIIEIIDLWFFFGLSENPVQKSKKSSASPPVAAGIFFAQNLGKKTCDPFGSRFIQRSSGSYFPQGKCFMHRRCAS